MKVNFDKFMRYRREIGMLAFRGENVDVLREQKKAIEENIMMLLHRIRDLQPAAIIRDTLDSVYFAESDLLSAHNDTTWKVGFRCSRLVSYYFITRFAKCLYERARNSKHKVHITLPRIDLKYFIFRNECG